MDAKSLAGISIVVTRPEHQLSRFRSLLEGKGARVIPFPTIEIRKLDGPEHQARLQRIVSTLDQYRWILFTSANGVHIFLDSLREVNAPLPQGQRIGAIGRETMRTLEDRGVKVTLCPDDFRAEGFLAALRRADEPALAGGARVLLARALRAREVLPEGLRAMGAKVEVLPVYETVASQEPIEPVVEALREKKIHCLTFTSSSTVECFFEKLAGMEVRSLLAGVVLACIGPITAQTLRERGLEATVICETFDTKTLADAIENHYVRWGSV